jgi:5-formyltetrahydrofolate cyclo-ligase
VRRKTPRRGTDSDLARHHEQVPEPDIRSQMVRSRKALLRSTMLQARAERLPEPHEAELRTAALLNLTEGASTVAAYSAFGTEPSTEGALRGWLERGTRVLLPVVLADQDLEFRVYDGGLVPGRLGMACPPPSAPIVELGEASIVVVPALACDRQGHRLGRGGGSYDRALIRVSDDALTVALLYPEELRPSVPVEPHDATVRAVLAGETLVHCRPESQPRS